MKRSQRAFARELKMTTYNSQTLLSLSIVLLLMTATLTGNAQRRGAPANSNPSSSPTPSQENKSNRKKYVIPLNPEYGTEVLIPEWGLKVRDVNYPIESQAGIDEREQNCASGQWRRSACQPRFRRLPQITSVQEKGPAFYAGLTPGDVISALGYDQLGDSNRLADSVKNRLQSRYRGYDVWYFYNINNSPVPTVEVTFVGFSETARGGWISEVPIHTGKGKNGRAKLKGSDKVDNGTLAEVGAEFEKLYDATMLKIKNNPCQVSRDELRMTETKLERLKATAELGQGHSSFVFRGRSIDSLNHAAFAACQNARVGQLTETEQVVTAIVYGRLKPCTYNSPGDLDSVDERFKLMTMTKSNYDDSTLLSIRNYLNLSESPTDKACFVNLLKSFLTGAK